MAKRLKVSEARRQLFDLFEEVISNGRARVIIGHRDVEGEAVLLSRTELERLEAQAKAVKSPPFSLLGSASLHVEPESVLVGVRREQAKRSRENSRS